MTHTAQKKGHVDENKYWIFQKKLMESRLKTLLELCVWLQDIQVTKNMIIQSCLKFKAMEYRLRKLDGGWQATPSITKFLNTDCLVEIHKKLLKLAWSLKTSRRLEFVRKKCRHKCFYLGTIPTQSELKIFPIYW